MRHSIFGLMSLYPHYNMLVISANLDFSSVQEKYYAIPEMLKIPMMVVITKVDMMEGSTPQERRQKLNQIMLFLKRELIIKLFLVDKETPLNVLD